jgi:hypothetical protein
VFAVRAAKVDRRCNSEHCDCDFTDRYVHRAPEFDKYAPGPVTTQQRLAEGWYHECSGCGDMLYTEDQPIYTDDDRVYCDTDCMLKHLADCKKYGHESWREPEASIERFFQTAKA